ncbi:Glycosyltransferase [Candidatus Defluviicoccus seviourii]|uniref:Glycosyltransferase n=1 Tax=Candidatus Defluviicoccus seviourii TaxID=2565273 RepID=A0A564WCY9_9PROT|nr:Glycosyltransferase [Candidatus Defluviicoccus seviourii]
MNFARKLPLAPSASDGNGRRICFFYHFYYPDDVVSARLFGDLCEGLAERGWQPVILTSNRLRRNPAQSLSPGSEFRNGVEIVRVWRPGFSQGSFAGRLVNSLWLLAAWLVSVARMPRSAAFIVGSDPPLSQCLFPFLKLISPASRVIFWCFDLYPDALAADKPTGRRAILARVCARAIRFTYRYLDVCVDIGPCMREKLATYRPRGEAVTLTPWALVEPGGVREPDPVVRKQIFGDASLALLYSGNLGHAHDFADFLALARLLRERTPGIVFAFAVAGMRVPELKAALREDDHNIRLLPLAPEAELQKHLEAADIHLVSLRTEWSGIVVPSKFFGSLAAGRPVLSSGSPMGCVGRWTAELGVGWVLSADSLDRIAGALVASLRDRQWLRVLGDRAFRSYHSNFSRNRVIEEWHSVLLRTSGLTNQYREPLEPAGAVNLNF